MNADEIKAIQDNVIATLKIEGCIVSNKAKMINRNYLMGAITNNEAISLIKESYLKGYYIYKGDELARPYPIGDLVVAKRLCKYLNKKYNPPIKSLYNFKPLNNRFNQPNTS